MPTFLRVIGESSSLLYWIHFGLHSMNTPSNFLMARQLVFFDSGSDYAQDRAGLTYTMLFCGSLDDGNVNKRLRSQLNNFFAYPTTLFIGRDGKVRAINSGFKG